MKANTRFNCRRAETVSRWVVASGSVLMALVEQTENAGHLMLNALALSAQSGMKC